MATSLNATTSDTFDQVADRYDAARPHYPEDLFDARVELTLTALEPGARLLEVGCGTGKATRPLKSRRLGPNEMTAL